MKVVLALAVVIVLAVGIAAAASSPGRFGDAWRPPPIGESNPSMPGGPMPSAESTQGIPAPHPAPPSTMSPLPLPIPAMFVAQDLGPQGVPAIVSPVEAAGMPPAVVGEPEIAGAPIVAGAPPGRP